MHTAKTSRDFHRPICRTVSGIFPVASLPNVSDLPDRQCENDILRQKGYRLDGFKGPLV